MGSVTIFEYQPLHCPATRAPFSCLRGKPVLVISRHVLPTQSVGDQLLDDYLLRHRHVETCFVIRVRHASFLTQTQNT